MSAILQRSPTSARSVREYDAEAVCIQAAAYDVTANFTSAERGSEFCDTVHSGVRERCYYGVGIVSGRLERTDEARVAACEALVSDAELVAACVHGGREHLPRS